MQSSFGNTLDLLFIEWGSNPKNTLAIWHWHWNLGGFLSLCLSRSLFHYSQNIGLLTKPVITFSYVRTYPVVQPHHSLVCKNKGGCGFLGALLCLAHQLEKIFWNAKWELPINFVACHSYHRKKPFQQSGVKCIVQGHLNSYYNALPSNMLKWWLIQ